MSYSREQHVARIKRLAVRRAALIARLGGVCEICKSTERLEFDHHPGPCEWGDSRKRPSRWQRMVLYEREADEGKLRLLCRSCNARDGAFVRNWKLAKSKI